MEIDAYYDGTVIVLLTSMRRAYQRDQRLEMIHCIFYLFGVPKPVKDVPQESKTQASTAHTAVLPKGCAHNTSFPFVNDYISTGKCYLYLLHSLLYTL